MEHATEIPRSRSFPGAEICYAKSCVRVVAAPRQILTERQLHPTGTSTSVPDMDNGQECLKQLIRQVPHGLLRGQIGQRRRQGLASGLGLFRQNTTVDEGNSKLYYS